MEPPSADAKDGRMKEALKLLALLGVLTAFYFTGDALGAQIKKVRDAWESWNPVFAFLLYLTIQFVRRSIPPLYMFFGPFGTIFLLFLSDTYGASKGAIVSQALKLHDVAIFLIIRHLYSSGIDSLCDPDYQIWWLSSSFRSALIGFDKTWRSYVFEKPTYQQAAVICVFSMTYFFNDYLCLFWFATRSKISFRTYAVGFTLGLLLEYPKTLMKFKIYTSAADTAQDKSDSPLSFFSDTLDLFSPGEAVLILLTTGIATCCVHGVHIKAVFTALLAYARPTKAAAEDDDVERLAPSSAIIPK